MNKTSHHKHGLRTGLISRRDFNTRLAALTAAGPGLIASAARAATPKSGGRLRVALATGGPDDHLDPHQTKSMSDIVRSLLLNERLVNRDADGALVPTLAESWEASPGADEWTIRLRKGVEFHNGKTVTAADWVYSLNRILDETTGSPARKLISHITKVTAPDPQTLRIKLARPDADLMQVMTVYHMTVIPEGHTDFSTNPVGAGPWRKETFEPGIGALFVRHPNYYIDGRPYIDEVETFAVKDNTARVNALLTDEADIVARLDTKLVQLIGQSPGHSVLNVTGSQHITYPMWGDTPPFDNLDVRLAIKSAIDRQAFADLVFSGFAKPGRDHPVPVSDPFHCDDIPVPAQDPDKVKYHLNKAGHANTEFELSISDGTLAGVDGALALAEMAGKAGLKIAVRRVPADGYWKHTWLKVPWCGANWYGRPTAIMALQVAYHSEAPWNESHWRRPEFDKLLTDASATLDTAKRKQMLCDLQWMLHKEGNTLIPSFVDWVDAHSNRVRDLTPHPDLYMGSLHWNDIWLDS